MSIRNTENPNCRTQSRRSAFRRLIPRTTRHIAICLFIIALAIVGGLYLLRSKGDIVVEIDPAVKELIPRIKANELLYDNIEITYSHTGRYGGKS